MEVLDNLQALFVKELQDIYSAETQIIEAMPMMIQNTTSPKLRAELENHLEQTKSQRERVQTMLEEMEEDVGDVTCEGMKGLLTEGRQMVSEEAAPAVKDAAIIASAQKVEHYEMASYGTAVAYAKLLQEIDAHKVLSTILKEEQMTDKRLNDIAMKEINRDAVSGATA